MGSLLEAAPGYWIGVTGEEGEPPMVELGEHAIRMHPMFDRRCSGPRSAGGSCTPRRHARACLCIVHGGWDPQDAMVRVENMSTVMLKGWPDFM